MTSKKQLKLSIWIAAILLVVGTLIYIFTALAEKKPHTDLEKTPPIRVLYDTTNGKVLFDHKTHTSETKYGLTCQDCHHHPPEDEEEAIRSCNFCHLYNKEKTPYPNCLLCHDEEEIEGVKVNKRVDSTHSRGECIKCHREFGKGPGHIEFGKETQECETCHYKK